MSEAKPSKATPGSKGRARTSKPVAAKATKKPKKQPVGRPKKAPKTAPQPSKNITVVREGHGVVRLLFNTPNKPVNVLNEATLLELDVLLEELGSAGEGVELLVVESAKPNVFIAGADIAEIRGLGSVPEAREKSSRGQSILARFCQMPFPTVAVINGACLGGGLELALWCDFRVATESPKTKIGLPEVNLGIIPGFGGCYRLPKWVGFRKSLELIAAGKIIGGAQAHKIGLADRVFYPEYLPMFLPKALEAFKAASQKSLRQRREHYRTNGLLERYAWGRSVVARSAEMMVAKKVGAHYPAPLEAVRVVKKVYGIRRTRALHYEARSFASLATTDVCQNLIQLFYTSEAMKKETGLPVAAKKPKMLPVERAGVVGAGFMGGGIAYLASKSGVGTLMKDLAASAVGQGYASARSMHDYKLRRRKTSNMQVERSMERIHGVLDYGGFRDLEVVVEAIVENLEAKKKVLREVEANTSPDAVIASNTSSLSITDMASAMKSPTRFAGLHFFSPVNRMPLVEVVAGAKTSPNTIARLVSFSKQIGKTPVVVKDCPGFLVNRLLFPYLNEAFQLVVEGSSINFIEKSAVHYGMPLGPFALLDEVGLDVANKVGKILHAGYGERMESSEFLRRIAEEKKFWGRKTGKGFYDYAKQKKALNKEVQQLLVEYRKELGKGSRAAATYDHVVRRCFLSMANEAVRCVEEGVVKDAATLDMAVIMATGFPAFRGGPLRWLEFGVGAANALKDLEKWSELYGERYRPADLLVDVVRAKGSFYKALEGSA